MDLDTTIKGFDLTVSNLQEIFERICSVKIEDDITFETVCRTIIEVMDEVNF